MLTRRRSTLLIVASMAGMAVDPAWGQDDDAVVVSIRADEVARGVLTPMAEEGLTIRRDDSGAARNIASRVPSSRALPILVIIVGAIAVVDLLAMIKELYRQTYYGGVLIDTRSQPPSVTSDPKIPASMVFVIHQDGTTTQFAGDSLDISALKLAFKAR